MDGGVVVHHRLHALFCQVFLQLVALVALGNEIDESVVLVRLLLRQLDRRTSEKFAVELRVIATALDQLIEATKAIAQHYGLHCIKPRHVAEFGNSIPVRKAMVAQQAHTGGDVVGIGGDEAGVTQGVEYLQWVCGETADGAKGTGPPIVMTGPHGLGSVFHHREIVASGARPQRIHVADRRPRDERA